MNCLVTCGLYPTPAQKTTLGPKPEALRYDIAKRVAVVATLALVVLSVALMILALNLKVHPIAGVAVFASTLLPIGTYLGLNSAQKLFTSDSSSKSPLIILIIGS